MDPHSPGPHSNGSSQGPESRLGAWRSWAPVISLASLLPSFSPGKDCILLLWAGPKRKASSKLLCWERRKMSPFSVRLLASCWRKERTMLWGNWLCWPPPDSSPSPFRCNRLSAPKPPLPEQSLDARVRYVVPHARGRFLAQAQEVQLKEPWLRTLNQGRVLAPFSPCQGGYARSFHIPGPLLWHLSKCLLCNCQLHQWFQNPPGHQNHLGSFGDLHPYMPGH